MSGKKDYDATKELPPDEPTQTTAKGLKIGLPKRSTVMDALRRVSKTTSASRRVWRNDQRNAAQAKNLRVLRLRQAKRPPKAANRLLRSPSSRGSR